jgi:Na+/proline symporter
MPIGVVGLLIAAIFAAAMSASSGELAALSAATIIDFYRRFYRPEATDAHYLRVSRIATGAWGLLASAVAVWASELGSLIEVVNRFGSFFYGSILGVFILAVGVPRATGTGAFIGLIAGMAAVAWAATFTPCGLPLAQRDRGGGGGSGGSSGEHPRRVATKGAVIARAFLILALVLVVVWLVGGLLRDGRRRR